MILGLPGPGQCFAELDDALVALGRGDVVLNAHAAPQNIPTGAVVWNFENVGTNGVKATPDAYGGHELWDFSARNCEAWRAVGRDVKHVPLGYHPSMERFCDEVVQNADTGYIDVVHVGCLNARRAHVLDELAGRGLTVVQIHPGVYGAERDAVLARARLCVAPLFYADGVFCSLRAAHLVANRVPMLVEEAPEQWEFIQAVPYEGLVDRAESILRSFDRQLLAYQAFEWLLDHPLRLPS